MRSVLGRSNARLLQGSSAEPARSSGTGGSTGTLTEHAHERSRTDFTSSAQRRCARRSFLALNFDLQNLQIQISIQRGELHRDASPRASAPRLRDYARAARRVRQGYKQASPPARACLCRRRSTTHGGEGDSAGRKGRSRHALQSTPVASIRRSIQSQRAKRREEKRLATLHTGEG